MWFVRAAVIATAGLVWLAGTTGADAEKKRRQLGVHTHGKATVAIAIERDRIELLLEAPADDILGFEHAPASDDEKRAVAEARKRLAKGESLFTFSPAARCRQDKADIEHNVLRPKAGRKGAAGQHKHDHASHAEIQASYTFTCGAPDKLAGLSFPFLQTFRKTDRIFLTVIGPKRQSVFEVTPKQPEVSLAGLR